ncbi:amino acid ABC transporter substrate-binding protein [Lysinibacillus sp. KCTC 33748]|uniref:transporter substrate-binding domain-containing protein n=1 Tax=unclassified Lysinibacillus TaxID=2636778 RepID=UPI0009A88B6E|nr:MULTISPECIES: transporter substrate-binding domain-containing protein [unclassified Lysinibacillus]OXS68640.1 amino acid ABC transporter substrate-binding protein [Lysinibacillus sp. KCTC 33748]SKC09670.1 amino acid ABC transporter substrate-binding protein, PAAT family [Lysinibacillus sp. AC-3]
MKKLSFYLLLLLTLLLTACTNTEKSEGDTSENSAAQGGKDVQKIIVGTGTQFPNICFIDDKGNLTGYDVELVRAIDEKLPEYEIEFKTMEFSNLLLSLETRKIDFIAHQMEVNSEREEKFLFNKEPYNVFPLKVTVNEKNNSIQSIDDLKGKNVSVSPTSNSAVYIEKYNKEHNLGANIIYSSGSVDIHNQLATGRIDAIITTPFAVKYFNESNEAQEKVVGDALLNSKVYFLLNKDEAVLQKRLDDAIRELKAEGVISKLSKKWLGDDYSVDF